MTLPLFLREQLGHFQWQNSYVVLGERVAFCLYLEIKDGTDAVGYHVDQVGLVMALPNYWLDLESPGGPLLGMTVKVFPERNNWGRVTQWPGYKWIWGKRSVHVHTFENTGILYRYQALVSLVFQCGVNASNPSQGLPGFHHHMKTAEVPSLLDWEATGFSAFLGCRKLLYYKNWNKSPSKDQNCLHPTYVPLENPA